MGSMKSILKMLPSVGPFAGMAQAADNVDEGQFTRVESIINSMTNKERHDHEIINGSRRKRIARGSGTTVQEVNNLLRQYAQMRKMFKTMGGGGGIKAQQRMMSQMQGRQKFGEVGRQFHNIWGGAEMISDATFGAWWDAHADFASASDVYFSAYVETDGDIPGPFSLLSFALVLAGTFNGYRSPSSSSYSEQVIYRERNPVSSNFEPEALL